MRIKYELYKELGFLIDQEEVSWASPAAEWQGNLYGVDGATEDDLPALNDIGDIDDIDEVAEAVKAATGYEVDDIDTGGCAQGEIVEAAYYHVVYDHLGKIFLAVSELETEPIYIYWDGSNWEYAWLPEPDAIVEVDVEEMASLDRWDGNNSTYGGVGCHAEYYKISRLNGDPVEDKYLLRHWSQWEEDQPSGEIISSEELDKIKAKAGE